MTPKTHKVVTELKEKNEDLEKKLHDALAKLSLLEEQRPPSSSSTDLTMGTVAPVHGTPSSDSVAPIVQGLTRPPAIRAAVDPPTEDMHKSTHVAPSTTSADSWQNVSVDNQDDKEQKKTDTIPDEESQYAFEDAVSSIDQDIVHVTGNEE